MIRIGIIGYGSRIKDVLGEMWRLTDDVKIAAICDVRTDEIGRELQDSGSYKETIPIYSNPDAMLDSEDLDGVMIGTRCSSHASMAIKVLARNLPLFLEKPVATNMRDLLALKEAAQHSTSEVVVSFPLRVTPHVQLAKEIIDSGKIGTVENVQAWNNVPYGWAYYQFWYRDENETQGLWLQKATHDFDYINYLVGTRPVVVAAMKSKQVFKGNNAANLKCKDCNKRKTCLESSYHPYSASKEQEGYDKNSVCCAFAVDTGNEDSGSAIVSYDTGMHLSYTQNFITRREAAGRGSRLIGYKGTIEFDWYTDEVKVYMHHTPRVETYEMGSHGIQHYGGDRVLMDNFINVLHGQEDSIAPLDAGLLSVLMCLKCKKSSEMGAFQHLEYPVTTEMVSVCEE